MKVTCVDLKQSLESASQEELSNSVHEYVGYTSESAQFLLETGNPDNYKPAKIILKNCMKVLLDHVPAPLVQQQGYLFVLQNHLA